MNGTSSAVQQIDLLQARRRSSRRRCLAARSERERLPVLLRRELIGPHHLPQRAEVLLLVGVLGIALVLLAGDEGRLAPRLELDRVGAGVGGRIDQSAAEVHVAVVVGADLGDDVGRVSFTDGNASEGDCLHAVSLEVVHRCFSDGCATCDHHIGEGAKVLSAPRYRSSRPGSMATCW